MFDGAALGAPLLSVLTPAALTVEAVDASAVLDAAGPGGSVGTDGWVVDGSVFATVAAAAVGGSGVAVGNGVAVGGVTCVGWTAGVGCVFASKLGPVGDSVTRGPLGSTCTLLRTGGVAAILLVSSLPTRGGDSP